MPEAADPALLASELRLALGQLVRRLRVEHRLSLTYVAVLARLDREGTQGISSLAAGVLSDRFGAPVATVAIASVCVCWALFWGAWTWRLWR